MKKELTAKVRKMIALGEIAEYATSIGELNDLSSIELAEVLKEIAEKLSPKR